MSKKSTKKMFLNKNYEKNRIILEDCFGKRNKHNFSWAGSGSENLLGRIQDSDPDLHQFEQDSKH